MASTKLIRKARTNVARAKNRKAEIKRITATPIIKKVSVEDIKALFTKAKTAKKAAPKAKKTEAKEEVKAETAE